MIIFKRRNGLTLIEVIVSIAILGIIVVSFLSAFSFGLTNLHFSGQKSSELTDLQTIVDHLNAKPFRYRNNTTVDGEDYTGIVEYIRDDMPVALQDELQETITCHEVGIAQISTQVSGYNVNFYVSSSSEIKAGTEGFTVTLSKFSDNGKRYSQLSTFILVK